MTPRQMIDATWSVFFHGVDPIAQTVFAVAHNPKVGASREPPTQFCENNPGRLRPKGREQLLSTQGN